MQKFDFITFNMGAILQGQGHLRLSNFLHFGSPLGISERIHDNAIFFSLFMCVYICVKCPCSACGGKIDKFSAIFSHCFQIIKKTETKYEGHICVKFEMHSYRYCREKKISIIRICMVTTGIDNCYEKFPKKFWEKIFLLQFWVSPSFTNTHSSLCCPWGVCEPGDRSVERAVHFLHLTFVPLTQFLKISIMFITMSINRNYIICCWWHNSFNLDLIPLDLIWSDFEGTIPNIIRTI